MTKQIENYVNALSLLEVFSEMRAQYENMLVIAEEEHTSEEIRREARELTKDGFDGYCSKMMDRLGREE